jgi:hypothetical protein
MAAAVEQRPGNAVERKKCSLRDECPCDDAEKPQTMASLLPGTAAVASYTNIRD